jgi:hypothetical protein
VSHRVQADQVVEIPSWARNQSFDIIGKAPAGVPLNMDDVGAMLRDLRELPVYALVQQKAGRVSVHGFPLLTLAPLVGRTIGRIAVDGTALTGTWDLEIEFLA